MELNIGLVWAKSLPTHILALTKFVSFPSIESDHTC